MGAERQGFAQQFEIRSGVEQQPGEIGQDVHRAQRPGNLDFIPIRDPLVPVKDDGARCRLIQQRQAVEQAVPLLAEFEGVGQNAEVCLDDEGGFFLFAPDRREEGDFAVDESKIERARRRAMFDRPSSEKVIVLISTGRCRPPKAPKFTFESVGCGKISVKDPPPLSPTL